MNDATKKVIGYIKQNREQFDFMTEGDDELPVTPEVIEEEFILHPAWSEHKFSDYGDEIDWRVVCVELGFNV